MPTWWPVRTPAARACCWTATGCGQSLSPTTSTTRRPALRSSWGGCARAPWLLWSRMPACPWCPTPAICSCAAAWPPGCRWRCCRDPLRRSRRWWPRGCRLTSGTSMASCRARRASCARCSPSAGDAGRFRVAAPAPRDAQLLAELDREREVAVCRELTKAHEEVLRGTATELAARYAAAPKGEIVLVLAPVTPPASGRCGPRCGRGPAPARGSRGAPAQGRHRGCRVDRRQRKRALPGLTSE